MTKQLAEERNGVKAPKRDGKCKQAWQWFDSATGTILYAHLARLAQETGLNVENLRIELGRWRRFHGVQAPQRQA